MSNKKTISNLPTPSVGGLSLYLAQIKKFPMLDAEEEYMLAKNWKTTGNFTICCTPRLLNKNKLY